MKTGKLALNDVTGLTRTGLWQKFRPIMPYLLTATLFAMGAFALYHLLAPVNLNDVMVQVRGTPWHIIVLALLATGAGYATLIGYDWSALKYLGKTLPFPVIVTGGFLGYALGNTIGAGPVSGGAVRYRIYSSLGLSGYDIAAIAIFGSVAFGLGATIIGFAAIALHPYALQSLTTISPSTLRWIASVALVVALGLVAAIALRKSELRIAGHGFKTPSLGLMSGQLLFTAVDILLAALVLYLLLPPNEMGFVAFLAVFAAAILAGVASHVPGGVGVFETVIIAALPASVPAVEAAAGLLLFRLVYYLVPFSLALVLLALSELRMASTKAPTPFIRALAPVFAAVSSTVPLAMAAMIFVSGIFMLLSAVIPASSEFAEDMEMLLPLIFVEGGALLSSAIGAALLMVAHGMLRRIEGAYWLAAGALVAGIVASLMQGLDFSRVIVLILMLLVLLPCRREFYRSARLTRNPLSLRWVLLLTSIVGAGAAVFFFAHKATPYDTELWWQFALDQSAPRAMRAGLIGAVLVTLLALLTALRPPRVDTTLPTPDDMARARSIIAARSNANANLALTGDKSLLFSQSGKSFLMYRVQARSWIALGDPVGERSEAAQLAWEFVDAANAANARPVFYEVGTENLSLWAEMGLAMHKMGEEAVIPLTSFTMEGSDRKKLRTAYNRAGRDGLSFELVPAPASDALLDRLQEISTEWLTQKSRSEKRFSVGRFDRDYLRGFPIAVVRHNDRIVAFANVLTTDLKTSATIDLMRHVTDAPACLMEYLFMELILHLKAQGYSEFSLGMTPLAGLENRRGSRWTMKLGALVYRHGGHFYNFDGLRNFKGKFDPEWRPRFLIAPPRANIVLIATDAATLIAGGIRNATLKG
ncbi:bifunctional lysylphosphatidylglycerol flippase/synthetase MprF [Celeribacter arenosi]|uniref:Phosphatidylglycerol lysyltransferase n=1 Tax=Celeribacter arenosi TaxID=792649 RepID=A0ABP7KGI8_9RHOB